MSSRKSHAMGSAIRCLSWLLLVSSVEAHVGNENDTEVRIYSDGMRITLRTSLPFAWSLLGNGAPAMADDGGKAVARPLLAAAAERLLTITVGDSPVKPSQTDCVFEVQNDVAFVLNFKRPTSWPVVVDAVFLRNFGNGESGRIEAYDYRWSRFSRDLKPFASRNLGPEQTTFIFSLADESFSSASAKNLEITEVLTHSPVKAEKGILRNRPLSVGCFVVIAVFVIRLGVLRWQKK